MGTISTATVALNSSTRTSVENTTVIVEIVVEETFSQLLRTNKYKTVPKLQR